jgi:hypothetical protein
MDVKINSLFWSGAASISNTAYARRSSHSNATENMDRPGFMPISSWVVLAWSESHYVPCHSCWTKYNRDPVQVPQVMQESPWCHLYPWYPKYRRWEVTNAKYYLSGSRSRGINTTNTEATTGHDSQPVLTTPFSHSLVSSLARKFLRIQVPFSQLKSVSFHIILCRTSVFLIWNLPIRNLNISCLFSQQHVWLVTTS